MSFSFGGSGNSNQTPASAPGGGGFSVKESDIFGAPAAGAPSASTGGGEASTAGSSAPAPVGGFQENAKPKPKKLKGSAEEISLLDLNDGILILLSLYLDVSSFSSLCRTCRYLHAVFEKEQQEFVWKSRLVAQVGGNIRKINNNDSWKRTAMNIHSGVGNYHGFALDAWTSGFEPYPMHLEIGNHNVAPYHNSLTWSTLRNSMTGVMISSKTRRTDCGSLDTISFSEVQLLRGTFILIPNHYKGFYCGPSIIGVMGIGGAFFVLRREALTEKRLQDVFLYGKVSTSQQVEQPMVVNKGMKFTGVISVELIESFGEQLNRPPQPSSALFELVLDERTSNYNIVQGRVSVTQKGSTFHLPVSIQMDVQGQPYDVYIEAGNEEEADHNNADKGIEEKADQNGVDMHDDGSRHDPRMLEFMKSCKIYGWFQGDCIVGLVKDRKNRTGSFFLQLQDCDRQFMLGLKDILQRKDSSAIVS